MNSISFRSSCVRHCLPLLLAAPAGAFALPVIAFSDVPLFLSPTIQPNLMVIFDNSQSMDATMAGKVINGNDAATRGNVARGVLRSVLTNYRANFNWGLTVFGTTGSTLYNTHAYYFGDAATMVYTNDCVSGVSISNGGRRCIVNPDAAVNGFSHLTYERSGDDADINDVLYSGFTDAVIYGIGTTGTNYDSYNAPRAATTGWSAGDFPLFKFPLTFTPTDAGFLPLAATSPRIIWTLRGWGYNDAITGMGAVVEKSLPDSTPHFNTLMKLLGDETVVASDPEIKNSAVFTPLTGSLQTVHQYFDNSTGQSPITQSCQRNFVVLATDGNPTGRTDGTQYNPSDWANTYDPIAKKWSFGPAQADVFAELTSLRSTPYGGNKYDIQTYVVGMGDSVANPSSIAALNKMAELGGGAATAFTGSSAAALTTAFGAIAKSIEAKSNAASSVALNGGAYRTGSALYQAKFDATNWTGNLLAYPVSSDGTLSASPTWEAKTQVMAQNWDTGRKVLTYKPSAALGAHGVAFRWPVVPASPTSTELDPVQITALNTNLASVNDGFGSERLRYLRGEAANEVRNCPCAAPPFRNRADTSLGDIVNSSPYYVGVPNFGYYDDMESAPYSGFVSTYKTRTPMIYVGANDGMLHAIDATNGQEAFAYVPSTMYSNLSQLTDTSYTHRYFVDGSPTVGDVFYSGSWHSLLVAGLRTGGKGLFALDVTDPANFSESNAPSIVRWEFQDPDMGYVFGQPLLVKTNNGRWSVIVSGGYKSGNANGHAYLFVIDARSGVLRKKIDTGAGTAASPNGLSAAAAIDTNGDGIADFVYAGDLDGNLWKFDISGATAGTWGLGNGGAPLFTAGAGQSITSRPDVTKFPTGGYLVSFGTGRYLSTSDTTDSTAQTEYGIRDTLVPGTVLLSELQQQTILQVTNGGDGNEYRLSTHAVALPSDPPITGDNVITLASYYSGKKGWYVNLPLSGERVVADARFRGGRVVMTSLIPDVSSACSYGGSGYVMEFDAITGNRLDTATFDANADNDLGDADFLTFPGYGPGKNNTSGRKIGAIPAAPGFMGNKQGTTVLEDKYINTSDGTVVRVRETAGKGGQGRVMWREVR
jgi:type IV pilus assembly protein PilY1